MNSSSPSLFNNPMFEEIKKQFTPEQLEVYRLAGEHMYSDDNMRLIQSENTTEMPEIEDAILMITESIKSGQHPSLLTDDERNLMEKIVGKEWFKNFGYELEDLKEIRV